MDEAKKIFETMKETNNKHIKEKTKIEPIVVFLKKSCEPIMCTVKIKTEMDRIISQGRIKKYVADEKMDGYILIMNGRAYTHDKATKTNTSDACMVRALYTPKEKICEIVTYRNGGIVSRDECKDRMMLDNWDIWGLIHESNTDIVKKSLFKKKP